jgi:hypothetical protein
MKPHWLIKLSVISLIILTPLSAIAQALADRVPDDAIVYVGWRGANSPGAGYDASHFKAFIDASQIPQLIDETLPRLLDKMVEKDPGVAEFRAVIGKLGPVLWKYPAALYIGPVDGLNAGSIPIPRAALIVQAGNDADSVKKEIAQLIERIPPEAAGVPLSVDQAGGVVAVMIGNASLDLGGKGKSSLATHKPFLDAMSQVGKDPVIAMYIDAEAIQDTVTRAIALYGGQQGQHVWATILGDLGLSGLKKVAVTMGFENQNWCAQSFVAAPAPRHGLLELFDAPPISDATLKLVPQSATMMLANHLDLAKLLDTVRGVAAKFAPGGAATVDSYLALAGVGIGLNIENDLLKPIGPEWALYAAPTVGGTGPLGLVLVNHARDGAKLEASLTVLERLANRAINAGISHGEPRPQFLSAKIGEMNVHYLDTPVVSPAWGVKDGNLYIALFPQTVAAAAAPREKSILDNDHFVSLRKTLGPGGASPTAISFFDLPRTTPDGYPYVLATTRLLGFADMFGFQTPPAVLPSLDKLMPMMEPAGQVAWSDDAGIHSKGIVPFPGAELFAGPEIILIEGNGFITSIGMPMLQKARARATEVHTLPPAPAQAVPPAPAPPQP